MPTLMSATYGFDAYFRGFAIDSVSILRQSRRLYGCWPLKGAFSQPFESKSNRNSKNAEMQKQGVLPELSNFWSHPGRAGGLPI